MAEPFELSSGAKAPMTAGYLVAEIFSRPQDGSFDDVRRITERQYKALRGLFLKEEPKGTVRWGQRDSLIWAPPGNLEYELAEDRARWKHTLTRMSTATPAESGRLF